MSELNLADHPAPTWMLRAGKKFLCTFDAAVSQMGEGI
jgi:hypothetical protein